MNNNLFDYTKQKANSLVAISPSQNEVIVLNRCILLKNGRCKLSYYPISWIDESEYLNNVDGS